MIEEFLHCLKGFNAVCRKESVVLSDVNDAILQANTLLKDYKQEYDTALSKLEDSVQALYHALPDADSELGKNLEMEMLVRGLGTISSWEASLDMTSFEQYAFDEIPDIESCVPEFENVDADRVREVFDLLERMSPPPREIAAGDEISPGAFVTECPPIEGMRMVMVSEADLRAMINILQAHLPAR